MSTEASITDIRKGNADLFNGQSAFSLNDEINKRYSMNLNSSFSHNLGVPVTVTPSSSKAKSENYVYELISKTQKTISNSVKTLFTDRGQQKHLNKTNKNTLSHNAVPQNNIKIDGHFKHEMGNKNKPNSNLQKIPTNESSDDDDDPNDPFFYLPNSNTLKTKSKPNTQSVLSPQLNASDKNKKFVFHPDQTAFNQNNQQPIRVSVKERAELAFDKDFERLYYEDEYFIGVHRKCTEWMNKHVLPNMPRILEKARRKH